MSTRGVPGDIPTEPSSNNPKKRSKEEPPQAERSSLPPANQKPHIDVPEAVGAVKSEQARQKAEHFRPEAPESDAKKLRMGKADRHLVGQIEGCFGVAPPQFQNLEAAAAFCFERARQRLLSPQHISSEEIVKIHQLFFTTDLSGICESALSTPVDPLAPHPAYVFKSLYDYLESIRPYPSFKDVVTMSRSYLHKWPGLRAFLEYTPEQRKLALPRILQVATDFQDVIDQCPLYTSQELLGGQNIHTVYVLRDRQLEPEWIFKPTSEVDAENELTELSVNDPPKMSIREHLAYALNFHRGFPIPATYYVEIKGFVGSVQLFIKDAHKSLETAQPQLLSVLNLQALLVYDLLFSNCDRHTDNILLKKTEQGILVFGIDHDSCMCLDNRPLKIDYMEYQQAFNRKFDPSIADLVSPERIAVYRNTMRERGMSEKSVRWMEYAGETIRAACGQGLKAESVAKSLITEFNKRHVE
ncbi:MAG TPA: hypothetical protein VIJ46_03015 [Rhabdochlamydiaceae bacterium]